MQLPKLQKVDPTRPAKKKILLLADDFRLPSGIGTISKEIIFNTVKEFDWIQLGNGKLELRLPNRRWNSCFSRKLYVITPPL